MPATLNGGPAAVRPRSAAGEVPIFQKPTSTRPAVEVVVQGARPGREDSGLGILPLRAEQAARRVAGRAGRLEEGGASRSHGAGTYRSPHDPPEEALER